MTETARQLILEMRKIVREAVTEALHASLETVNVKEAAALLKTSPGAIYARKQRGQMPPCLPGGRLVWRKSDLLKLSHG